MRLQVNIRMEEGLKKDLEQMAQEEGRSLNNMIVHLLKCAVVNGGILRRAKVKRFDPNTDIMLMGKEKEDGGRIMPIEHPIVAFTHREQCNRCLWQGTPHCVVYGKGMDGELGCSFTERTSRSSELKESFDGR